MPLVSWARLGAAAPFDPKYAFVSSQLFSPAALAGIRTLIALYALCTICTVLGFDVAAGAGPTFLCYFTELSYIGLTAYYVAAAVQTLFYARWQVYPLRRWPRVLQALHVLLQATVTTYPIIVTVVFWALLSSPSTFSTRFNAWSNISIHAINTPFALFEIFLTNAPPAPWLALPVVVFVLALYLALAYVVHATQGFYPYPFLNPDNGHGRLAGYILGIAAGGIIVFSIVRGIVVLRCRFVARWRGRRTGRDRIGEKDGGSGPTREGLEDWEEVQVPVRGKEGTV
ncbi:hypothetical protein C8R44DRAFT_805983 [Mycena epipterygia]|nr:hypothetical protein C8R44DRAFT_805983 [Mycena epipterygia]